MPTRGQSTLRAVNTPPNAASPARAIQGETERSLTELLTDEAVVPRPHEVRRALAHVLARGNDDFAGLTQVRKVVLARIAERAPIGQLRIAERVGSSVDPFVKYLFELPDGHRVEAVRIPLERAGRFSVCVSSQVGCALACRFCATGAMGFHRNLRAWEIVEQVRVIQNELRNEGLGRVHGVVFQGMGEPMLNLANVLQALRVFCDPSALAIDVKHCTVCTAGIPTGIRQLADAGLAVRLAISVISARQATRRRLMPIEGQHPLTEVLEAAKYFYARHRDLVVLSLPVLAGENTTTEDVDALRRAIDGLPVRLSLVEFNDFDGAGFRRADEVELGRFRDALAALGVPVVRRYSGGSDVGAACGQLSTDHREGATIGERAREAKRGHIASPRVD